jgi:hypothetical protein
MPYRINNLSRLESITNKTTVINADSTDLQYPSAKAVFNLFSGGSSSVVYFGSEFGDVSREAFQSLIDLKVNDNYKYSTIVIKPGTYYLNDIMLRDGLQIIGESNGEGNLPIIVNTSEAEESCFFKAENTKDIHIRTIAFGEVAGGNSSPSGLEFDGCENIKIGYCKFNDFHSYGVVCSNSKDIEIYGCEFVHTSGTSLGLTGNTSNVIIKGCNITSNGTEQSNTVGVGIVDATKCFIERCHFSGRFCKEISVSCQNTTEIKNIIVKDNILTGDINSYGIYIDAATSSTGVSITNNIINGGYIGISASSMCEIRNNVVENCNTGVVIYSGLLTGNTFKNCIESHIVSVSGIDLEIMSNEFKNNSEPSSYFCTLINTSKCYFYNNLFCGGNKGILIGNDYVNIISNRLSSDIYILNNIFKDFTVSAIELKDTNGDPSTVTGAHYTNISSLRNAFMNCGEEISIEQGIETTNNSLNIVYSDSMNVNALYTEALTIGDKEGINSGLILYGEGDKKYKISVDEGNISVAEVIEQTV